jgi:hypothetical protein
MATDLRDQIHDLMEHGIAPLSAAETAAWPARSAAFPVRKARWQGPRSRRMATITTACAVACVAAVLTALASSGSGHGGPRSDRSVHAPAVLTAAMLRHVTSASMLALAQSGRAIVMSRETLGGTLQQSGTADITFDGLNWNDSFTVATPAGSGLPASRESAINRVVDGRAYDYFVAADGLAWYHEVGPDAVAKLAIPDPRALLRELAPAARFADEGTSVVAGVRVTKLTATNVQGLPTLNSPQIWPSGAISALTIWVDGHGVVRQVAVTGTQTVRVGTLTGSATVRRQLAQFVAGVRNLEQRDHLRPAQAMQREKFSVLGRELSARHIELIRTEADVTTMTIRFTGIGQPQLIRVPADSIRVYGRG